MWEKLSSYGGGDTVDAPIVDAGGGAAEEQGNRVECSADGQRFDYVFDFVGFCSKSVLIATTVLVFILLGNMPYIRHFTPPFTQVSLGMRFRMVFQTEESGVRRYIGTVTGISDIDSVRWKSSQWRPLQVIDFDFRMEFCRAKSLTAPLDRIKLIMQVQRCCHAVDERARQMP
ncbi:hypothetical protein L2E82_24767 [Cichorium intybus]|uniref:Uncharacterized protein n=1 Tax=Cichorium intybus TaxID=13427 RepID=A0ACB9E1U2_CICIN|nr:hypothetical protein L2E82_24767 [Cichorium intybus]